MWGPIPGSQLCQIDFSTPAFLYLVSKAVSDSKWATLTNPTRARTRTPPKMNQVGPKVGPKNDQKMESISVPFELVCNEFVMKRLKSFKNKHNFLFCSLITKLLLNYLLKPCRESFQSVRQRYCSFEKVIPWSVNILKNHEFRQENLSYCIIRNISSEAFKRASASFSSSWIDRMRFYQAYLEKPRRCFLEVVCSWSG